jgi:hypothetical protein
MIRRFLLAWAAFWLGVVAAIIVAVVVDGKIGLLVFAGALGLTIVLVILAIMRGKRHITSFITDLTDDTEPVFITRTKPPRDDAHPGLRPQPHPYGTRRRDRLDEEL